MIDPPSTLNLVNLISSLAILHLHRSAFIEALADKKSDPFRHKFASSVLAVHRSCNVVIENMKNLLSQYPSVAPRVFVYGLQAFSAGVSSKIVIITPPDNLKGTPCCSGNARTRLYSITIGIART